MLAIEDRELLKDMAKLTNLELPDLDTPADHQSRLIIHSMIRIHDELMASRYLKPMVENARTDFSQELLFELNRRRGELVELEVRVFTHLNDVKP